MFDPLHRAVLRTLLAAGLIAAVPATASAAPYKFLLPRDVVPAADADAIPLADYGSFALYASSRPVLDAGGRRWTADMALDVLTFAAQPFDTQRDVLRPPSPFASGEAADGAGLMVVQFVGPLRREWLEALQREGMVPVQYVPSNGYLVWRPAGVTLDADALRDRIGSLQYAAPLAPFLKLDARLQRRLERGEAESEVEVDVVVQIVRHTQDDSTRRWIEGLARLAPAQQGPLGPGLPALEWESVRAFDNLHLRVRVADLAALARQIDVSYVGEQLTMQPMDEVQGLILAGDLIPSPASTSYLDRLRAWGFSEVAADYPIIDITDTPVHEGGSGNTVLATADPTLYVAGDPLQASRVAYFKNCTAATADASGDIRGHGTINASIAAGYDGRPGAPFRDDEGWQRGMGINPFARIGSTSIFSPNFDTSACGGGPVGLIRATWNSGARISNNSWGSNPPPLTYETVQQAYDAGVRDADSQAPGNQEIFYVFAAGNLGAGGAYTVSSPGAAKNVLAVGASENVRPQWTDDCNWGPAAADNAADMTTMSSRGPTRDGRVKPELAAPGTHVQGSASLYPGYDGLGVCDTYYPRNQTVFAASSGTSHAAPAVAAAASLADWWIRQGGAGAAAGTVERIGAEAVPPSPAALKAWLVAHPTYLTGAGAGDTLPSNVQGYGMPNLDRMFDTTPKVVVDQADVFTTTGQTATYRFAVADPSRPVRIAMVYTDAPGMAGAAPQVNDLDLSVSSGATTWLGNVFSGAWSVTGGVPDPLNTTEAVFLSAGAAPDVQVTVTARNVAGDALNGGAGPSQDFALVCSNCERASGFSLELDADTVYACAGSSTATSFHVGSIGGFEGPVNLMAATSLNGTAFVFDPNPVTAGHDAVLNVMAPASSPAATHPLTLQGVAGSQVKTLDLSLRVYSDRPPTAAAPVPADGANDVGIQPTFTWAAVGEAYGYRAEVATDPAFAHVVARTDTTATEWTLTPVEALDSNRRYWWRVVALNACGASAPLTSGDTLFSDGFENAVALSDTQMFVTAAVPSDCPLDQPATVLWRDDIENGAQGWTHGAITGIDGWSLGSEARLGGYAWQAVAPPIGAANDQWLTTAPVTLPATLTRPSLRFWQRQSLRASASGTSCQDAALLEVSADGGQTWTQLTTELEYGPYDGTVTNAYQSPLAGRPAWCGDPRDYRRVVAALGAYAGRSVQFRFRLGHDRFAHRTGVNWAIDDVTVQACPVP